MTTVLEREAVEEFHGDEGLAGVLANVVNGADVGVTERRGRAGFPFEALEGLRVVSEIVGKKFESDKTAEARVFGFVDDAHSTAAEFIDDAVVRDGLADQGGRLRHWWGDSMRGGRGRQMGKRYKKRKEG